MVLNCGCGHDYAASHYIVVKCSRWGWNCSCDAIAEISKSSILRLQMCLWAAIWNH